MIGDMRTQYTLMKLALLTAAAMLYAGAAAQTVLYDKSSISCVSRQENVPVEAQFRKFSAQIAFDPSNPAAAKAQIEIDVGSFDIGFADFNDEAKGKSWFDVKTFPQAKFVAAGIRSLGSGRFEARGPLTIKGKTIEVTAPFTYKSEAGAGTFDGVFTIKRLLYNIGEGAWKDTDTVADDVQIKFHIVVATKPVAAKK
jgi:polyisoprenoid-binding protein YceI